VSPLVGFEVVDRLAEHGAGQSGRVQIQEGEEPGPVVLAGFAQHPSDGLVDQVVVVTQQHVGTNYYQCKVRPEALATRPRPERMPGSTSRRQGEAMIVRRTLLGCQQWAQSS
jgi:hypothetical protein